MANKKNTSKVSWKNIFKFKKLWFIIGLLIIVPLVCITFLYINSYSQNKPTLFSNHAEVEVKKNFKDFDFNVYASEITFAKTDDEDKVTTNGKIIFKAKADNNDKTNFKLTKITSCQIMCGANWINYSSTAVSVTASTIKIDDDSYTSGTAVTIEKAFPQKPLLFVNIKNPTLYVYLQYEGKCEGKSIETHEVILEIPYSKYFSKSLTVINDPSI